MSPSPPPTRVKGGPPLWLWIILAFATCVVVLGVLLSSAPENPQLLYESARADLKSGDVKAARNKITRLQPIDNYKWHAQLLDGLLAYRELRDPRALKLFSEIPEGHELKAEALKMMGDSYRRSNKFKESLQAYQSAVALSPDSSADASLPLSNLYFGIGAYALAERALDKTIQQDPDDVAAHQTRAMIRSAEMRYDEAIQDFQKVLSTPGQFSAATPSVLTAYANCLIKTNKTELVQELVDQYSSLFEDEAIRMALAIAAGRPEDADAAREARPDGAPGGGEPAPLVKKMMALAAAEQGQWEKAEDLMEPLFEMMPRDTELFEMATRIYKETQNERRLAVAEENLKQLKELRTKLMAGIKDVSGEMDNAAGRAAVGRMYMQLGEFTPANFWHGIAASMDDQFVEEAFQARSGVSYPSAPFVKFPDDEPTDPVDNDPNAAPGTEGKKPSAPEEKTSEDAPAKDPDNKEPPAQDSPDTDAANSAGAAAKPKEKAD